MNRNRCSLDFSSLYKSFDHIDPYARIGKVISSRSSAFEVNLPHAQIGSTVEFVTTSGVRVHGEVISISDKKCMVVPYGELDGVNTNTLVYLKGKSPHIKLSKNLLGRIVDFEGNPMDGKGPIEGPFEYRSVFGNVISPFDRPPVVKPLDTGIKAINGFLTVGKGQKISIMAGSGVGKSVLLGMIARNTSADVNVIALVGERGREVREFIEFDLGEEGLKKSIIIVGTSDQSPFVKVRAAYVSATIAEYFRDQNQDVVYMMDSITRFAMAYRDIYLSSGESPGQKGYPPSVFSKLPGLLERAGTKENSGSVTGFYSVLVEGGDMDEPITDALRGISDGHIVLSRELTVKNHYPAIDILQSISRVMNKVVSKEHQVVANYIKEHLSLYQENEDFINLGSYVKGSSEKIDKSIIIYGDIVNFLSQDVNESLSIEDVYEQMIAIAKKAEMNSGGNVEQ